MTSVDSIGRGEGGELEGRREGNGDFRWTEC